MPIRTVTALFALLILSTACSDREAAILAASDPQAQVGSACGVWRGEAAPGHPFDGWNATADFPAGPLGTVSVTLWQPGGNQWGHPWNGYYGITNADSVNTPGVDCHNGGFYFGPWSQTGNALAFESYATPGGTPRYDGTAAIVDSCAPGYAGGIYCDPSLGAPQSIMEGVVHDRLAFPGCPSRYHFVARFSQPSSQCP